MKKTILQKAQKITSSDRAKQYGNVKQQFKIIADVCIHLGISISPADLAKINIVTKLVRESNKHKKDNLIDLVGYARLLSVLEGDEDLGEGRSRYEVF